MPEFVACPACGCRVQMAESMLGKAVRCISCNHRFTAASPAEVETRRVEPLPPVEPPPLPERSGPPPLPALPEDAPRGRSRPAGEPDEDYRPPPDAGLPRCPRCGRPVSWDAFRCFHCGEQLEFGGSRRGFRRSAPLRRDAEPHRGPLLSSLGNITLAAGGFTLCLVGAPLLITAPLGAATLLMATKDLKKMRTGEMEPEGRGQTESARTSAIIGIVLSVLFAAGWGLLGLSRLFH